MNKDTIIEILKGVHYPGYSRDIISFGIIEDVIINESDIDHSKVLKPSLTLARRHLRALPRLPTVHRETRPLFKANRSSSSRAVQASRRLRRLVIATARFRQRARAGESSRPPACSCSSTEAPGRCWRAAAAARCLAAITR